MKDEIDELPEEEEQGVLVGGGSFRVDRERALELLGRYRSPEAGPVMFLARAASASGASRVHVSWRGSELEVAFDGLPFTEEELSDPYAALFEGASRAPARFLAQALLHAFRPGVTAVTVSSGTPEEAFELKASSMASEALEPGNRQEAGTTVRFSCSRRDDALLSHPVPAAEIACRPQSHFWGRLTSDFTLDSQRQGLFVPRGPGPGELLDETPEGPRILLSFMPPPESRGLLDLYHHGVYAGRLRGADDCPDVLGKVDDPELKLNASHTSLVRSKRLDDLKGRCRVLAWDLVGKVASEQADRMPDTAALLRSRPDLRELWRRRFARGADAELDLYDQGPLGVHEERVLHDAAASAWLRSVMGQFWSKAPLRVREPLETVPIFLGQGFRLLSRADIGGLGKAAKAVAKPGNSPEEVWCETAYQGTLLRKLK